MSNFVKEPNKYGGLTEARLLTFEKKINSTLPADYRSFMLSNNGGQPENELFSFYNEGNEMDEVSVLECFLPIHDNPYKDSFKNRFAQPLEDVYKTLLEETDEKSFIPIARDPCGNLICLSLNAETFGQIFFFDHEQEIFSFISQSFTEFFNNLERDTN